MNNETKTDFLLTTSRMTRRRFVSLVGGAVIAGLLPSSAAAQRPGRTLRTGLVVPTRTGGVPVASSVYETAGEAARMGAMLAEFSVARRLEAAGYDYELLLASAPSADAARRAAERLVIGEGVSALIGGVGDGQAEAISAIAEQHGILFFNIGCVDPILRQENLRRHTFHIQASADMYLDALVGWHRSQRRSRWFIITEDSPRGERLHERAAQFILKHGGAVVDRSRVETGKSYYGAEFGAMRESTADVVLLLLDPRDEIAFFSQFEFERRTLTSAPAVAVLPNAVNTNRDYMAALNYLAPGSALTERVTLWETTLDTPEAAPLNEEFTGRWGSPMDPAAWAAYEALHVFSNAVVHVGSSDADALIAYLERPGLRFSAAKDIPVAFSRADHQLRQPLYLISMSSNTTPGLRLSDQLSVASVVGQLPELYMPNTDPWEAVQQLGCLG